MESNRSTKKNESGSAERHDPFAVDFFGDGITRETEFPGFALESVKESPLPQGVTRDWAAGLDAVARAEGSKTAGTPAFPIWLEREVTTKVLPAIHSFARGVAESYHFETISFEDVSYSIAAKRLAEPSNVIVRFESWGQEGMFAVGGDFASELIGKILGGKGSSYDATRDLSSIELAICEYLSASALSVLNKKIDKRRHLRIIDVRNGLASTNADGRAVEIVAGFLIGGLSGMITVLLPSALAEVLNREFEPETETRISDDLAIRLEKIVGDQNLCLRVGETTIKAVEIPFLEPEDVILIERPVDDWWRGSFDCGTVSCFVGASSNLVLRGAFETNDGGRPMFRVDESSVEAPARNYARIARSEYTKGVEGVKEIKERGTEDQSEDTARNEALMANESPSADLDAGLVALENVMVDLRVQVAGRKISLSELGKLRAGQIIDLGCTPEDPVELVTENSDRPIASGELVKIEEQLGVRITKVFV